RGRSGAGSYSYGDKGCFAARAAKAANLTGAVQTASVDMRSKPVPSRPGSLGENAAGPDGHLELADGQLELALLSNGLLRLLGLLVGVVVGYVELHFLIHGGSPAVDCCCKVQATFTRSPTVLTAPSS